MNSLDKATSLINNDDIVGIPTETVYGLAGSIYSPIAINKIFSTKERPFFDPLIVHVSSVEMAKSLCRGWNEICDALSQSFWPGPLTIVMKKTDNVSDLITSGLDSVGLRIPNHSMTIDLINRTNSPLAAPSANKFKKVSPTSKRHVNDEFEDEVFVLDGGECEVGIESTVISVSGSKVEIYRPGMITKEMIDNCLVDFKIKSEYTSSPVAPGQLKHHYMPKIPIILLWDCDKTLISGCPDKDLAKPYYWEVNQSPATVARELYSKFRFAQENAYSSIIINLSKDLLNDDRFRGVLNRLDKAKSLEFNKNRK